MPRKADEENERARKRRCGGQGSHVSAGHVRRRAESGISGSSNDEEEQRLVGRTQRKKRGPHLVDEEWFFQ